MRAILDVSDLVSKIEHHLIKAKAVDDNNESSILMLKHVYKQVLSLEELSKIILYTDFDKAIGRKAQQLMYMACEIEDSKSEDHVIKKIKEDIDSFISDKLKKKEEECSDGLYNVSLIDDDAAAAAAVSEVVTGVSEVYQQLKHHLQFSWHNVTSLVGMAGIGKTTLANKLFNDPTILESFDHRLWIRLGKRYRANDIPRLILQEIHPYGLPQDEEAVGEQLKGILKSERYFIVLDDVWDRFTGIYCVQLGVGRSKLFLHMKVKVKS